MESAFLKILNMSLTGSYVILAVLLARLLLKRAPKKYSYALWAVAAFRLLCPVSLSAAFSLFSLRSFSAPTMASGSGTTITYIPTNIAYEATPQINIGLDAISDAVNSSLPQAMPSGSVNPIQVWIFIGTVLWCAGMLLLAIWAVVSYFRIHRNLRKATLLEEGVYECERVRSPFILGIFKPRIYLPYELEQGTLDYVLTHERCHIRWKDHIVKILAYGILTLHWFNPLCWIAYYQMCKDMEMRCDEYVLQKRGAVKTEYSMSLLSIASNRRFPSPSPLAFAESGVKTRIKNILKWKKPKTWVSVLAVALCLVCLIGCAVNPEVQSGENPGDEELSAAKSYVTDKLIYLSPLSSSYRTDDDGCRYLISDDKFVAIYRETGAERSSVLLDSDWTEFPVEEQAWKQMFKWSEGFSEGRDIFLLQRDETEYRRILDNLFLLRLREKTFLVEHYTGRDGNDNILSIYSLREETAPSNPDEMIRYVTGKWIYFGPFHSVYYDDDMFEYRIGKDSLQIISRISGEVLVDQSISGGWINASDTGEFWHLLQEHALWTDSPELNALLDGDLRIIDDTRFLIRDNDVLYIAVQHADPKGNVYLSSVHSLRVWQGYDNVAEVPVVEYAKTVIDEAASQLWISGKIQVEESQILEIEQVSTGTASERVNIMLFRFDYRLKTKTEQHSAGWHMEEGWLVPDEQTYLLLENTIADNTWRPICVTTEEEIQENYGTEEMLSEYGCAYTAAAMELWLKG